MKKIIMITLIIAMALFATSCGAQKSIPIQNNDDPISPQPTAKPTQNAINDTDNNDYITDDNKDVDNIENNQEQPNNDNDNDNNTEEITEITEDNIEIIKNDEPKEDNRKIIAMSKINKLLEARRVLLQQNKAIGNCVQYDIENLSIKFVEFPGDCVTKDDYWITSNYAFYAVGAIYYYNYVNNNTGYYDFFDWISEQPSTDYILKTYKISKEYGRTTNDLLMLEAIRLSAFLDNCKEIKIIDLVETDKYTISGIKSSYIINLECDGIKGLFGVFDKNDNLLNICSTDDWDYYISSFPNGFNFR